MHGAGRRTRSERRDWIDTLEDQSEKEKKQFTSSTTHVFFFLLDAETAIVAAGERERERES